MSSIQSTQSSPSLSSMNGSQGSSSKAQLRAKMEAKFQASGLTREEFRTQMMQSAEGVQTMRALQSMSGEMPGSGAQSEEPSSQVQSGRATSDAVAEQFGIGSEIDIEA